MSVPSSLVQALADRYRIEREIGAGGMATVYLAHDVRHDRQVAVKILRPELAAIIGGERFLHEIRTTANLQHPHILPLHDSGEAGGNVFYVMPFVEGQSLRDRLHTEKQLPVDDAVRITREVASALDYAHRHGVVHRDIKPENILLHDGQALVADFGIALAVSRSEGGSRMTETGMSLGTPHYMAPEQAMGEREITPRADVYALGCVLYECLSGEPPFTGPTAQAIIARVMTDSPRGLATQRRTIPPHIEAAVRTALEKLPADRFASAAAFSEALGNPSYGAGTGLHVAVPGDEGIVTTWSPRTWRAPTRVFAGLALLLAGATAWLLLGRREPTPTSPSRLAFTLLDSTAPSVGVHVSNAGTLAWVAEDGLHIRRAGETEAALVPGTEDAEPGVLDFSPDGEFIVYAAIPSTRGAGVKGALRKVALAGGGPQPVTNDLPAAGFESTASLMWSDDGRIYIAIAHLVDRNALFLRVDANGGPIDTVAVLRGVYGTADLMLPGGKTLLVTVATNAGAESRILAIDLATRDTTQVATALTPTFTASGHLVFVRIDGTMQATLFDPRTLQLLGPPITVADSVSTGPYGSDYALSPNGTLVYTRGPPSLAGGDANRIVFVKADGTLDRVPLPPTDHPDGSVSPDGRRIAYTRHDAVWLYDLDLGTHRQFTEGGSNYHNPLWSPDGTEILYAATRDSLVAGDLYIQRVDSAGPPRRVGGTPLADNPGQWLADGTILHYTNLPAADIFRTSADGKSPTVALLNADWAERGPRVSPDGRWIAFQSNEGGENRWTVRRWPSLRDKVVVSEGVPRNSSQPLWSADSRTLTYQEGRRVLSVTIAPGDDFRVASRRTVAEDFPGSLVAMHPDGRLFGFVQDAGAVTAGPVRRRVIVVMNWDQRLRGLAARP